LIHPFAGLDYRAAVPITYYIDLINWIIDEHNMNVVVVGGSHKREGIDGGCLEFTEGLNLQRDGLYNLVNHDKYGGARVATELAMNAKMFIGTHSCYVLPAWINEVQTILISPDLKHMRELLVPSDSTAWCINKPFNSTIWIDQKTTDFIPVINQIKELFNGDR